MILQKNKLKESLIHLIRSCGLNISKLSKVNYSIYKLHSINLHSLMLHLILLYLLNLHLINQFQINLYSPISKTQ